MNSHLKCYFDTLSLLSFNTSRNSLTRLNLCIHQFTHQYKLTNTRTLIHTRTDGDNTWKSLAPGEERDAEEEKRRLWSLSYWQTIKSINLLIISTDLWRYYRFLNYLINFSILIRCCIFFYPINIMSRYVKTICDCANALIDIERDLETFEEHLDGKYIQLDESKRSIDEEKRMIR